MLLAPPALRSSASTWRTKNQGRMNVTGPSSVSTVTSRLPTSRATLLALLKPTKSGRERAMGRERGTGRSRPPDFARETPRFLFDFPQFLFSVPLAMEVEDAVPRTRLVEEAEQPAARTKLQTVGLLGVKVLRASTDIASALGESAAELTFGAADAALSHLASAGQRAATRLPTNGLVRPPSQERITEVHESLQRLLLSARAVTATGLELSSRLAHSGLAVSERLLRDAGQLDALGDTLGSIVELLKSETSELPAPTLVATLRALHALSCLQAAHGPLRPSAAASWSGGCTRPPPANLGAEEAAELRRFFIYSSAAYGGALALLRGSRPKELLSSMKEDSRQGLAKRLGLPLVDVPLFEPSSTVFRPAHFVAVLRTRQEIIVSFRGSLSLLDSLTNLTCQTAPAPGGGAAHQGMLTAAGELASGALGTLLEELRKIYPSFALRFTGHSLGAGIAALLARHYSRRAAGSASWPGGVRAYAFAPPAVLSLIEAGMLREVVTSVVLGDDLISRLSLGHVDDLRCAIRALASEPGACGRVLEELSGELDRGRRAGGVEAAVPGTAAAPVQQTPWIAALRATLNAHMQNESRLYPPGRILWLPADRPSECAWVEASGFSEILLTPACLTTHLPAAYETALGAAFPESVASVDDP